jgi:hypothetical protein
VNDQVQSLLLVRSALFLLLFRLFFCFRSALDAMSSSNGARGSSGGLWLLDSWRTDEFA